MQKYDGIPLMAVHHFTHFVEQLLAPKDRMLPTFNDWRRKFAVDVDRGDSLNYDEMDIRRHRPLRPEPVST